MKPVEKLYRYHTENLRAVARGLEHVFAAGRQALARGRDGELSSHMRLAALLLGAWSECRLLKLVCEPKAFDEAERAAILKNQAFERWTAVVETGFRRHFKIRTGRLVPPALPHTASLRLGALQAVLAGDLSPVITMRNKLAHGQWHYPLNDKLDDVAQQQMDGLRGENLLSLELKRSLIESLCAVISDLAVSPPAFDRDWDRHFAVLEQVRVNIQRRSYESWARQLREKWRRGQAGRGPSSSA